MKLGKPTSKRTPVRLRHKIEKKASAKQRKDRKAARKDPTWRSRLKKDPGIPNLYPYKDRLLKEIEEGKRRKEDNAAKSREQARALREGTAVVATQTDAVMADEEDEDVLLDLGDEDMSEDDAISQDESSNPMAALLASARSRAADFDPGNASDVDEMDDDEEASGEDLFTPESKKSQKKDTSRRAYAQTLNNLISTSDILLYVLDARDPQSTRSPSIEQTIAADPNKRLIFILNKIDLVPADVLKSWLLYLRRSNLALPLRSSSSAPSAKTFDHKHLTPQFTAGNVTKALKSYSTSRASTTVGIIGYPNVGKSSVINALVSRFSGGTPNARGKKECPVGAEAGVTTVLREVKLDNRIKLIDSPGVVFPASLSTGPQVKAGTSANGRAGAKAGKKDVEEQARLVLLNALPPHEIGDPIPAVSLLLQRMGQNPDLLAKLHDLYGLPALMSSGESKDSTTDFLVQVARKRGRLGKGGVPSLYAAAQTVIGDWRDGRIQGWVEAPKAGEEDDKGREADRKEIVSEWAKEFKIEGLWGESAVS